MVPPGVRSPSPALPTAGTASHVRAGWQSRAAGARRATAECSCHGRGPCPLGRLFATRSVLARKRWRGGATSCCQVVLVGIGAVILVDGGAFVLWAFFAASVVKPAFVAEHTYPAVRDLQRRPRV